MDTTTKLVTVDTNLYQDKVIIELGKALPYLNIYATSVTETEVGAKVVMGFQIGTAGWGEFAWGEVPIIPNKALPGVFTIGQSKIGGNDRIAPDGMGTDFLQSILDVATTGSVQYLRDVNSPSKGIRNHIRDAKILQIHCVHGFNIFVSNDTSFFGKPASTKREQLEALCNTKIMTGEEFKSVYLSHIPEGSYIHDIEG